MDWLSLGKIAAWLFGTIGVAGLVILVIRRIERGGAERQRALDAAAAIEARKAADAEMRAAADAFARKGGAEDALKKGEF
jgi:hypothetical protein